MVNVLINIVRPHQLATGFMLIHPMSQGRELVSGVTYCAGRNSASSTRNGFSGVRAVVQFALLPIETGDLRHMFLKCK
jgi:hypothetical protein